MGRPTSLDQKTIDKIIATIRLGGTETAAYKSARVPASTYFLWKSQGEKGIEPYLDFLEQLREAEAEAENRMTAVIVKAAVGTNGRPPNAQAAMFWLKARRRKEWGDAQMTVEAVSGHTAVRVTVGDLTTEQLYSLSGGEEVPLLGVSEDDAE